jgi:hypothetical protein
MAPSLEPVFQAVEWRGNSSLITLLFLYQKQMYHNQVLGIQYIIPTTNNRQFPEIFIFSDKRGSSPHYYAPEF